MRRTDPQEEHNRSVGTTYFFIMTATTALLFPVDLVALTLAATRGSNSIDSMCGNSNTGVYALLLIGGSFGVAFCCCCLWPVLAHIVNSILSCYYKDWPLAQSSCLVLCLAFNIGWAVLGAVVYDSSRHKEKCRHSGVHKMLLAFATVHIAVGSLQLAAALYALCTPVVFQHECDGVCYGSPQFETAPLPLAYVNLGWNQAHGDALFEAMDQLNLRFAVDIIEWLLTGSRFHRGRKQPADDLRACLLHKGVMLLPPHLVRANAHSDYGIHKLRPLCSAWIDEILALKPNISMLAEIYGVGHDADSDLDFFETSFLRLDGRFQANEWVGELLVCGKTPAEMKQAIGKGEANGNEANDNEANDSQYAELYASSQTRDFLVEVNVTKNSGVGLDEVHGFGDCDALVVCASDVRHAFRHFITSVSGDSVEYCEMRLSEIESEDIDLIFNRMLADIDAHRTGAVIYVVLPMHVHCDDDDDCQNSSVYNHRSDSHVYDRVTIEVMRRLAKTANSGKSSVFIADDSSPEDFFHHLIYENWHGVHALPSKRRLYL